MTPTPPSVNTTSQNLTMTSQPLMTSFLPTNDSSELLAELIREQQSTNVAVVVVLVVVIVVGLVGNLLVIGVYRPRLGGPAPSPAVLFILVMAGLDVGSCLLTVPYEILDLLRPYTDHGVSLCQTFRFLSTVIGQYRAFMLLCVAWDRYFKVCLPLFTYSYQQAKVVVLLVLIMAVAVSWPQIPLNGAVVMATRLAQVMAPGCNIVRPLHAVLFHGVLCALFIVYMTTYAVLYGRIFYVLWRKGWFNTDLLEVESQGHSQERQNRNRLAQLMCSTSKVRRESDGGDWEMMNMKPSKRRRQTVLKPGRSGEGPVPDKEDSDTLCEGTAICIKLICPSVTASRADIGDEGGAKLSRESSGFHEMDLSTGDCVRGSLRSSLRSSLVTDYTKSSDQGISMDSCACCPNKQQNPISPCAILTPSCMLLHNSVDESSQKTLYAKEKHPRARYNCNWLVGEGKYSKNERLKVDSKSGESEHRRLFMSWSEPNSVVADVTIPLLVKRCCTNDGVLGSWKTGGGGPGGERSKSGEGGNCGSCGDHTGDDDDRLPVHNTSPLMISLFTNVEGEDNSDFNHVRSTEYFTDTPVVSNRKELSFSEEVTVIESHFEPTYSVLENSYLTPKPPILGKESVETSTSESSSDFPMLQSSCLTRNVHSSSNKNISIPKEPQTDCCTEDNGEIDSKKPLLFVTNVQSSERNLLENVPCLTYNDNPQYPNRNGLMTGCSNVCIEESACFITSLGSSNFTGGNRASFRNDKVCIQDVKPAYINDDGSTADACIRQECQTCIPEVQPIFINNCTNDDFTRDTKPNCINDCTTSDSFTSGTKPICLNNCTSDSVIRGRNHIYTSDVKSTLTNSGSIGVSNANYSRPEKAMFCDKDHLKLDSTCGCSEHHCSNLPQHTSPIMAEICEKCSRVGTSHPVQPQILITDHRVMADASDIRDPNSQLREDNSPQRDGIVLSDEQILESKIQTDKNHQTNSQKLSNNGYLSVPNEMLEGSSKKHSFHKSGHDLYADDHAGSNPCLGHIRRHGGKRLPIGKTTLMLAMVTLSTMLSFIPFLTVIVLKTSGVEFDLETASTGSLVYMFCIRSYLLNNIVNPFVYFYVNPRFRFQAWGMLRRLGLCLHRY